MGYLWQGDFCWRRSSNCGTQVGTTGVVGRNVRQKRRNAATPQEDSAGMANQGYGRQFWLVHGFFRANGGCGYVKKPGILILNADNVHVDDQNIFNPKKRQLVKATLKVKVYMGNGWTEDFKKTHFDMYSPPDFYTRIGIAGVPADTKMKKTQIIEDEWTPYWGKEFAFPLTVPELALLRIEVHEYNMSERDEFGGQTCLPVAELKPGIRTIPLYNKKGEKYKAVRLLVRIEFIKAS